MHLMLCRRLSL